MYILPSCGYADVIGDSNSVPPLFFGHGNILLNYSGNKVGDGAIFNRSKALDFLVSLNRKSHRNIFSIIRLCLFGHGSYFIRSCRIIYHDTVLYRIIWYNTIIEKTKGSCVSCTTALLAKTIKRVIDMSTSNFTPATIATPTAPAFKCGISTSYDDFKRRYPTGNRSDWHTAKAAAKRSLSTNAAHKAAIARNWSMGHDYIQGGAA